MLDNNLCFNYQQRYLADLISYERDTAVYISIKDHSAVGADEGGVEGNEGGSVCMVIDLICAYMPTTNFFHRCYMNSLSHLRNRNQDKLCSDCQLLHYMHMDGGSYMLCIRFTVFFCVSSQIGQLVTFSIYHICTCMCEEFFKLTCALSKYFLST